MDLLGFFILGTIFGLYEDQSKVPDIRNYFNKNYCEEAKVGKETIKKCYVVLEVMEKNNK